MSMLDQVAAYIDAQTSLTVGTDLWKGLMPDTPDAAVCIYATPGQTSREYMNGDQGGTERPNIQVLSRAPTYAAAEQTAFAIWSTLRLVAGQTLSGVRYLRIQPLTSPFSLGYDENRRARVAFNAMIEKELG